MVVSRLHEALARDAWGRMLPALKPPSEKERAERRRKRVQVCTKHSRGDIDCLRLCLGRLGCVPPSPDLLANWWDDGAQNAWKSPKSRGHHCNDCSLSYKEAPRFACPGVPRALCPS